MRSSQRYFAQENFDPRLRAGLVGHWIGGGIGQMWMDRSGYRNHGPFFLPLTWNLGEGGKRNCVDFSGGVNYAVRVPDSPTVSLTGAYTIAAWINTRASAQQGIVEKYTAASNDGFILRIQAGGTLQAWNMAASTPNVSGATVVPLNTWVHVASRYDGVNLKVYLNGKEDGTTATSVNPADGTSELKIGERGNGGTNFNGRIDDVRMYNRALSEAEIKLLATPAFVPVLFRDRRRGTAAAIAAYFGRFFAFFN